MVENKFSAHRGPRLCSILPQGNPLSIVHFAQDSIGLGLRFLCLYSGCAELDCAKCRVAYHLAIAAASSGYSPAAW